MMSQVICFIEIVIRAIVMVLSQSHRKEDTVKHYNIFIAFGKDWRIIQIISHE